MKMSFQRILLAYSAILSTALAAVVLMGASSHRNPHFDEIQVHRIDVVEPDGTLRMVISDHDQMPGVFVKGKESPKTDRPQAGMLFYNDEGTETGGLIFGGHLDSRAQVIDSGASLSIDGYGTSQQVVQLAGIEDGDYHFTGLAINEPAQHARNRRVFVGRGNNDTAVVALMDGQGRKRIVMQVAPDGKANLDFLDAEGHVVRELIPGN